MDPESNGNSFDAADEPVPDTPTVTNKPFLLDVTAIRVLGMFVFSVIALAVVVGVRLLLAHRGVYVHASDPGKVYVHALGKLAAIRRVYVHS